ncbi:uncharacterized protein LOC115820499 [Chanos chanos]|uniref:Uncharacterized protein LOC115820499 n=1 Tax=Chanos chanos TaxID=29144 RepID=A0A6J2W3M9_CHACN|nr:uncharacterized protein LOC115820499 [Chanos chanos]
MEARMNIFKSWKEYIQRAIKKLDELEKSNDDAVAEDSSVYALSEDKNFIVMNELVALYEYGLGIVFEVKKKPRFCFDALICFILGVIQVIAGILVCALSFGTASQFGLGLISEGVSDMINGIEGMIKGTFDWASWAISKSISIGMALLSAGFSTIKKVVTTGFKVTKGLLTGTKSFSSLADDVLQSGKKLFLSLKGAAKQTTSSFSKQAFGSTVKKLSSSTAVKQNFKHASRYALQELGKEAANSALNYLIDEGVQAFFKTILQSSFKDTVTSAVKQNDQLALALTDFISSSVPKAALEKEPNDFKINKKYETVIQETVDTMTDIVISDLMIDCTTAHDVINKLTDVCEKATDIMEQARLPGVTKRLVKLLEAADYTSRFVECLSSVPTKKIIDETLVPKLLEKINEVQLEMGESSQDERRNLPDVKRLKDDLLCNIAEKVSQAFIESCSGHITNIMTKSFKRKLNKATGKAVGNVLGKYKTQSFFDDQRHKHNMKSASHKKDKTLSESEEKELKSYLEDISNVNHAATAFDIYVLTKSDLIQGKGIRLIVCDKHGRRLSEECYPGMDNSAGEITLRLTKQPVTTQKKGIYSWIKKRVLGEREPYLGHFDIIQANGKVIQVKSDKQNCLYHAIVLATSNNPEDVKQEAVRLREKVKNEVKLNFKSYTQMLRLQKGYDETHKNPGKYAITGGIRQERDKAKEARKKHQETLKSFHLSKEEYEIIKAYNLGYVDNYKCVTHVRNTSENNGNNNRKRTVNADHIPPKNSIKMAWQCIQANPERREELKTQNPGLYNMLQSSENDQLAMEVFKSHHMQALTTGRSKESTLCRELITESLVGGDTEKMLKHSLILANPQMSQQLKRDAGVTLKPQQHIMTTQKYYKIGYTSVVEIYFERGVIDQNQKERLSAWVHQDKYLSNETPEYQEILKKIRKND